MEISLRLEAVLKMAEKCNCIADIGTDHAYIPIISMQNNLCKKAIASDIHKGPLERAKNNIKFYSFSDKIECRLGEGLSVLKPYEANGCIIAGMGGYLISDIIIKDKGIFDKFDFAVLQPAQHADYLRKYLITNNYHILDEDLCLEDGKYYEIIKVVKNNDNNHLDNAEIISNVKSIYDKNSIYYEVSKILIQKNHPLLKKFIDYKIKKYKTINSKINILSEKSKCRKNEILNKINELEELLKCF